MFKYILNIVFILSSTILLRAQITSVPDSSFSISPFSFNKPIPDIKEDSIKKWMASIDSKVKLTYNDRVSKFIDYFTSRNRAYTQLMIQRKNLYFDVFEQYLAQHNLPDELKYLSIVESGLNPKATSRAKAVGLWQFMGGTGKLFQLHQDHYIDERMDINKSTEAACLYLKQLYGLFKDWELAISAYNCGPGVVKKALKKSKKKTFWDIYTYLPRETRSYLPQFIAVTYTMSFADAHGLTHDQLDYAMDTDTVMLTGFINLKLFAKLSGICQDDFLKINPALKQNYLPDYMKNYPIYVPSDLKSYIVEHRKFIVDSASKVNKAELLALVSTTQKKIKTYYTAKKGETLTSIAKKSHVKLSTLAKWNKLKTNRIKVGQKLIVWKTIEVKEPIVSLTTKKTVHVVQYGDSLWTIAQKYSLTIQQIKNLNQLKDNMIKPGQKLIVG